MIMRAYVAESRSLPRAEANAAKLRIGDRILLAEFCERIRAAVKCDPKETQPIDVPWAEWKAYTTALNDTSGA